MGWIQNGGAQESEEEVGNGDCVGCDIPTFPAAQFHVSSLTGISSGDLLVFEADFVCVGRMTAGAA